LFFAKTGRREFFFVYFLRYPVFVGLGVQKCMLHCKSLSSSLACECVHDGRGRGTKKSFVMHVFVHFLSCLFACLSPLHCVQLFYACVPYDLGEMLLPYLHRRCIPYDPNIFFFFQFLASTSFMLLLSVFLVSYCPNI
jgi:hypothetical protein